LREIGQYFVITKSEDDVAMAFDFCRSGGVIVLLEIMDIAINFDRELASRAIKIQNKISDWMLTAKSQPDQLFIFQGIPEVFLGWGQILAERSSGLHDAWCCPPNPIGCCAMRLHD
jgi:hypothetical protein